MFVRKRLNKSGIVSISQERYNEQYANYLKYQEFKKEMILILIFLIRIKLILFQADG